MRVQIWNKIASSSVVESVLPRCPAAAASKAGKATLMIAGGQILPVLRKLAPSNQDIAVIWRLLRGAAHPMDFVVLIVLGWGTVPLFAVLYYYGFQQSRRDKAAISKTSSFDKMEEDGGGNRVRLHDDFLLSYMFQFANHIAQASQLAIIVYLVDCLTVILTGLGFTSWNHINLSTCFAKILYILWASQRLSVFKRYLLRRAVAVNKVKRKNAASSRGWNGVAGAAVGNSSVILSPMYSNQIPNNSNNNNSNYTSLGQAAIIDRLVDGLLWVVTLLFLLDILEIEMGVGVSSIFAFGSAGTLVMGLASKDVASMFVSGLTLTTSDHVREGDHVKFGDGTVGQVTRIGWMHTTIRGYDELIEMVPNSVLGMQRVKNISRLNMCQVKENLRLRYEDAERIPSCCAAILDEISKACPLVVTDGTRPFRAVWRGFEKDHLVVMVDVHFNGIKPIGTKYFNNRQETLLAIHRAVQKSGCQFVTTVWPMPSNT